MRAALLGALLALTALASAQQDKTAGGNANQSAQKENSQQGLKPGRDQSKLAPTISLSSELKEFLVEQTKQLRQGGQKNWVEDWKWVVPVAVSVGTLIFFFVDARIRRRQEAYQVGDKLLESANGLVTARINHPDCAYPEDKTSLKARKRSTGTFNEDFGTFYDEIRQGTAGTATEKTDSFAMKETLELEMIHFCRVYVQYRDPRQAGHEAFGYAWFRDMQRWVHRDLAKHHIWHQRDIYGVHFIAMLIKLSSIELHETNKVRELFKKRRAAVSKDDFEEFLDKMGRKGTVDVSKYKDIMIWRPNILWSPKSPRGEPKGFPSTIPDDKPENGGSSS